jgi:hypothetical protein
MISGIRRWYRREKLEKCLFEILLFPTYVNFSAILNPWLAWRVSIRYGFFNLYRKTSIELSQVKKPQNIIAGHRWNCSLIIFIKGLYFRVQVRYTPHIQVRYTPPIWWEVQNYDEQKP